MSSEIIITAKDHLVSKENFDIVAYKNGILKTTPVPEDLSAYYESDSYISHTDNRNNLMDKIYGSVKSYMLSKKKNWISALKKEGKILDIGAGTGDFLNRFQDGNWKTYGVEPNKKARDFAAKKNLNLVQDLNDVKTANFDVISLWHVLEHIPNLEEQLKRIEALLDEKGILIIAVPNYESFDAKYYKSNWAAWDTPRHLWHFSRSGIKAEMQKYGFECFQTKALIFDSYYVSLLSEQYKGIKGLKINAIKIGLKSNLKARSTKEYSSIAYFFRKAAKNEN